MRTDSPLRSLMLCLLCALAVSSPALAQAPAGTNAPASETAAPPIIVTANAVGEPEPEVSEARKQGRKIGQYLIYGFFIFAAYVILRRLLGGYDK